MPTLRQKKLAKAIIENSVSDKPLNKKELVVSVGYSPITADVKAGEIMEQKGVKKVLDDYGFNVDNAKKVVAEILSKKDARDNDRLKAADMIFDVHGAKAPQKSITAHIDLNKDGPNTISEEITMEYEERLRQTYLKRDGDTAITNEHPRVDSSEQNQE